MSIYCSLASQEGINQDQTVSSDLDEKLETHNLAETLGSLDECSEFAHIVRKAGLDGVLRHSGLHTLFAVSNRGMQNYSPPDAQDFLDRHLVAGGMEEYDLRLCDSVKNVGGRTLRIEKDQDGVRIENSRLIRSDLPSTNGIIHVIDSVIF
ncbi:MAG: fasciclin domain-containing protein [Acidobacteriaceae bacterium]|nr:fasciclin domain-containing protein [Acidobacteriaceae bacterium]